MAVFYLLRAGEIRMPRMKMVVPFALCLVLVHALPHGTLAQDTQPTASAVDVGEDEPLPEFATGLTNGELRTLVGPIALYPDTLLIQVLVSATVPFDVLKADRFLLENPDAEPQELSDEIAAQNWDESVEVLALGFPDLIGQMANHIEWTEALGTAMLAQQDEVLQAVQDLRDIALANGALESNEAVEVTEDENDNIIIVPATPEVVYVPQYKSEVVYVSQPRPTAGDVVATSLIIWGTFVVVDAIFGPSYRYWGCRNCCGWSSGRVYNNININIDGNNNIIGNRPGESWRPGPQKRVEARDRITDRRSPNGATTLPVNRPNRNDDLRRKLSNRTGAPDIADRVNRDNLPTVNRGINGTGAETLRERSREGQALTRPNRAVKPGARPATKPSLPTPRPNTRPVNNTRPSVNRPTQRPTVTQPARRPAQSRPPASRAPAAKKSIGGGARTHSTRGKASRGSARPNRR